ncbi:M20 family metallopeptidase [Oceanobacillus neutriphilus]|uniref:Peptidase M20 domain-containing protein 2 n=1 Tax=Oceanobacillus neutriphilus TaxID=531815 RepID=A0ABQ2NSR2_9BACI|nr:M20 family metallopeptidase [Oceanobacillus neutriphilus]GGP09529.1 amidohydrolase [Oceanobacillus neutriphilus]
MEKILKEKLADIQQQLWDISEKMYYNPELGDEEFASMELLTDLLSENQFQVETNIINRPTAFKAVYDSGKPGPAIAYLAEYDALPDIGHGCGHNLIGTMSTGAGIALSKVVNQTGGKVVVFGTPAEETHGSKVPMSKEGTFEDIDVTMILHPEAESRESGASLANDALEFIYTGKAAHAAASPEEGINALDSVIQLYNGINALREHLPDDVSIHGIITKGGEAANVVPDLAAAEFYIRAQSRQILDETKEKVIQIAKGAALMTGAEIEIIEQEGSYDNMVTNRQLSDIFTKNLKAATDETVYPPQLLKASMDMGDVSRVVPAIHPSIGIGDPSLVLHTKAFADQTISPAGKQALLHGALALACTGYDILSDSALLEKIREEFEEVRE